MATSINTSSHTYLYLIESPPGGSTAALLVCGRRSAICFYFWAGSEQVLGKFLAVQEGDTHQTSKCVPGGSKMAVQTSATLPIPDRHTRKEHLNTGQKARKNRSQIAQTIAKILLFRSPKWAKACDGGQNVPRSHFRPQKEGCYTNFRGVGGHFGVPEGSRNMQKRLRSSIKKYIVFGGPIYIDFSQIWLENRSKMVPKRVNIRFQILCKF